MTEVISVNEGFAEIVAGLNQTAAEALGTMAADVAAVQADGQPAGPTAFETLARTPDAIQANLTRLAVFKNTTNYTLPEGEHD